MANDSSGQAKPSLPPPRPSLKAFGPFVDALGARLVEWELDRAVMELDVGPQHINGTGVFHGGCMATVLDTALAHAARPLVAIAAAAARVAFEGYEIELSERVEVRDAFALFTADAAKLAHLNAGAIEPGKLADLAVLSKDPLAVRPTDLMNLTVDITLVGGHVIYERCRPAVANSASADLLSTS